MRSREPLPSRQHDLSTDVDGARSYDGAPAIRDAPRYIDRFVILGRLGEGAMGVVYSAFDPDLDRKVALKLLRNPDDPRRTARLQTRFTREARAMARLSHPNVVAVYEVGLFRGEVFIAMEFVRGMTLRDWLAAQPRSPFEALEVFIQAGRGLAAAHDAGLIHRDFKPDNVLIGDDGRVRVSDFGLVRKIGGDDLDDLEEPDAALAADPGAPDLAAAKHLTRTGEFVGTPAYMALEQMLGVDVGPRSDQFSFCVALYEALYGHRPFRALTVAEIVMAIRFGEIAAPPSNSRVPPWLRRIVLRGLACDPEERWPSMQALLAALVDGTRGGRGRWIAAGAASIAIISALWLGARDPGPAPCTGGPRELAEIWSPAQAQRLTAAFRSTGVPAAERAGRRVAAGLDRYATAWKSLHHEVCAATTLRGEQSHELLDLRMGCLRERRSELGALVQQFLDADGGLVARADQAVAQLVPLAACNDAVALGAAPRLQDDEAPRLLARLAETRALTSVGRDREATQRAAGLVSAATALASKPLLAEALIVHGRSLRGLAEYRPAEDAFKRAWWSALGSLQQGVAFDAALQLAGLTGLDQLRLDVGAAWAQDAAALAQAPGVAEEGRIALHMVLGRLAAERAEHEEARLRYAEARMRASALDPNHAVVHEVDFQLALLTEQEGRYVEAERRYRESLGARITHIGAEHPDIARHRLRLGGILMYLRRFDESQVELDRGRLLLERHYGPRNADVARAWHLAAQLELFRENYMQALAIARHALNAREDGPLDLATTKLLRDVGIAYEYTGRYAEARAAYEREIAGLERIYGPDHPNVATSLTNLGNVLTELRDFNGARRQHARAIAIFERTFGGEHPSLGVLYVNLGFVDLGAKDWAAAHRSYSRALALRERNPDGDPLDLVNILSGLGEALLRGGRPEQAVEQFERLLAVAPQRPREHFMLAESLWPSDRVRAMWAAERSVTLAREQGDLTTLGMAEPWIAARQAELDKPTRR